MPAPLPATGHATNGAAICNAESIGDMQTDQISRSAVLAVIESEKDRWRKFLAYSGLSESHPDPAKQFRFTMTQARLLSLLDVSEAVNALPSGNLSGRKSIPLESVLESAFMEGCKLESAVQRRMTETAAIHRHRQRALVDLAASFSGNAGTQPKTREEASEPTERVHSPSTPLPAFLDSLSLADLHQISELALEAMERRPQSAYEFTVADKFQNAVRTASKGL